MQSMQNTNHSELILPNSIKTKRHHSTTRKRRRDANGVHTVAEKLLQLSLMNENVVPKRVPGSKIINLDEIADRLKRELAKRSISEQQLRSTFEVLDPTNTGYVTEKKFLQLLMIFEVDITTPERNAIIEALRSPFTSGINWREFVRFVESGQAIDVLGMKSRLRNRHRPPQNKNSARTEHRTQHKFQIPDDLRSVFHSKAVSNLDKNKKDKNAYFSFPMQSDDDANVIQRKRRPEDSSMSSFKSLDAYDKRTHTKPRLENGIKDNTEESKDDHSFSKARRARRHRRLLETKLLQSIDLPKKPVADDSDIPDFAANDQHLLRQISSRSEAGNGKQSLREQLQRPSLFRLASIDGGSWRTGLSVPPTTSTQTNPKCPPEVNTTLSAATGVPLNLHPTLSHRQSSNDSVEPLNFECATLALRCAAALYQRGSISIGERAILKSAIVCGDPQLQRITQSYCNATTDVSLFTLMQQLLELVKEVTESSPHPVSPLAPLETTSEDSDGSESSLDQLSDRAIDSCSKT